MQQSREDAWGQSRRLVIKLGSQGVHEQNGLSAEQLQEQPRRAFRRYCREGEGAENGRARIRHNGRQSQVFGIIAAEEGADGDVARSETVLLRYRTKPLSTVKDHGHATFEQVDIRQWAPSWRSDNTRSSFEVIEDAIGGKN